MTELILVRHGETESNVNGTYTGWTDIGLNDKGIMQAFAAREKLSATHLDAVYSSTLKRASKTAEIINEVHNIDICYTDNLNERNFGCWEEMTNSEVTQRYPKEYAAHVTSAKNEPNAPASIALFLPSSRAVIIITASPKFM